jgi:ABC-2 type transport system permease protein
MSLTARVVLTPYPLGPALRAAVQALRAEWTKFRTVAGSAGLLAGVVTLTVAVAAAAVSAAQCQSARCGIDPATVSFTGIYPGQAVAAVAGALAIGNEYSTGMIKLSLTAMPRRLTWFFAKATTLIALLSLGVAAVVRDSAVAIGVVLGVLYLFPLAAAVISNPTLSRHLQQIGPLPAGLDAEATIKVNSLPLTPWQGLGVVAVWTGGALLLGALVLKFRDA